MAVVGEILVEETMYGEVTQTAEEVYSRDLSSGKLLDHMPHSSCDLMALHNLVSTDIALAMYMIEAVVVFVVHDDGWGAVMGAEGDHCQEIDEIYVYLM